MFTVVPEIILSSNEVLAVGKHISGELTIEIVACDIILLKTSYKDWYENYKGNLTNEIAVEWTPISTRITSQPQPNITWSMAFGICRVSW